MPCASHSLTHLFHFNARDIFDISLSKCSLYFLSFPFWKINSFIRKPGALINIINKLIKTVSLWKYLEVVSIRLVTDIPQRLARKEWVKSYENDSSVTTLPIFRINCFHYIHAEKKSCIIIIVNFQKELMK